MKKSDSPPSSKRDQKERAQGLREKLKTLKLQTSPPKSYPNYSISTNGSRPVVDMSPPSAVRLKKNSKNTTKNNYLNTTNNNNNSQNTMNNNKNSQNTMNNNENSLNTTTNNKNLENTTNENSHTNKSIIPNNMSPPKIISQLLANNDNFNKVNENNCGVNSINESISQCHHTIMKKFFSYDQPTSDSIVQQNSLQNNQQQQRDEILNSTEECSCNDTNNTLNILQSNNRLKYKFNTKYELDYGNNVLRARNSYKKPLKLYNPTLLRAIHRKLSGTNINTSSVLLESLIPSPILNEENIVCLLENGIENKPIFPIVDLETSPPIDNDASYIIDTPVVNDTKPILKKSTEKVAKNITFSIDVQYYDAIINGDLETVKNLVPLMGDFSKCTARGKTPLHLAVESGELKVVDYFIEKGLDVNDQDIRGQTPLHLASYNNNIELIDFLLKSGASPYIFSDFLDGFPSMVINECLSNAYDCIDIFEDYNKNLGTINNGIVYPICDWAGDITGDLLLKEMSAIVVTERNDMLLAKKWKAVDKHAKRGFIPWQIITLYPTRNFQNKYQKHNAIATKKQTLQTIIDT